ncbi:MAG TPA: hypothetical protein DCP75_18405 [Haliea salexigens]|uniref:Uncharacterized protein n=1 Tax=Haliea salexigens TaxID=287487 RepID=A0A3C1KTY3_9GAMM|nr:hypothetical protein [Haliea salexigens]|tara:strand:+ start:1417 stop:1605 length:189 start_codon:yes stop_codon:yes gene_type:complete
MNRKDKFAFLVSSVAIMLGLFIAADEGPEGLILCAPVALYWLYRYFSRDISFIDQNPDQGEQ